jgi:hypothetical protein
MTSEGQATEAQAIGRAYRQGQQQEVQLFRFLVRNSVEDPSYGQVPCPAMEFTFGDHHGPYRTLCGVRGASGPRPLSELTYGENAPGGWVW